MDQQNLITGKNMNPFIVRELVGGVLVSLACLLHKPFFLEASYVAFKVMRFNAGCILGIPVPDFERLSRDLSGGFIVSKQDLDKVLVSDVQLIDGIIEFVGASGAVLLTIECVDATQWELSTEFPEIEAQLERSGFRR